MKTLSVSMEDLASAVRRAAVTDVGRQLGVSEAMFYVWKKTFAHRGVSERRRTAKDVVGAFYATASR